jgi:hypothetical protein
LASCRDPLQLLLKSGFVLIAAELAGGFDEALRLLAGFGPAYGTPLIFKVSVEAQGLPPEARKALRSELAKAVGESSRNLVDRACGRR